MSLRLLDNVLVAEDLDDPAGWNRFLPVPPGSDRHRFETAAQAQGAAIYYRRRGRVCTAEYDAGLDPQAVLTQARDVARELGVELAF